MSDLFLLFVNRQNNGDVVTVLDKDPYVIP